MEGTELCFCCSYCGGGGGEKRRSCCCHQQVRGERRRRSCRNTETFLHRTVYLLTVLVLLLLVLMIISAAVTFQLLIIVMERGDHQGEKNPDSSSSSRHYHSHSSGISSQQQQQIPDVTKPCAIITAPCGNKTNGNYMLWEHAKGMARCVGGFRYCDGDLLVPTDGLYTIFLQITFESKSNCSGELPLKIIVFVLMDSYREDVAVLSSTDTAYCNMIHWKKSLHTSGIVYLERNSRLRVKASHPELIMSDENLVFFGAGLVTVLPDREADL